MLTIKNKIILLKYKSLVKKRNKEFLKGHYTEATYYGKLVDKYMNEVLKI